MDTQSPVQKQGLNSPAGFDLPAAATYHTRPMPQGWSKPRDLDRLAEQRAQFEFEIPLGDLPGIPAEFSFAAEPVQVWLRFGRDRGVAAGDARLRGRLHAQHQRRPGATRLSLPADAPRAPRHHPAPGGGAPAEQGALLAARRPDAP